MKYFLFLFKANKHYDEGVTLYMIFEWLLLVPFIDLIEHLLFYGGQTGMRAFPNILTVPKDNALILSALPISGVFAFWLSFGLRCTSESVEPV